MFFAKFLTAMQRLHARGHDRVRVSLLFQLSARGSPTLFGEFLSFLVSKFVKLCQNGGDPVKGGTECWVDSFRSFFVFAHCVAAQFFSSLFFSFCIRFAPWTRRGRRDCRAFAHCYCLFACARSFSQRGISGSQNCKSQSELATGVAWQLAIITLKHRRRRAAAMACRVNKKLERKFHLKRDIYRLIASFFPLTSSLNRTY